MGLLRALTAILVASLLALATPVTAHAADGWCPEVDSETLSAIDYPVKCANAVFADKVDPVFGAWVVGPLATVMFWDVAFWDNTLTGDAAIGASVGNETVLSYDAKGYGLARSWQVPTAEAVPSLTKPVIKLFGPVAVSVELDRKGDAVNLVGTVLKQPAAGADVSGFFRIDEIIAPMEVETLAPFPVMWDPYTGTFLPDRVDANGFIELAVGDAAWAGGAEGTVTAVADGQITLQSAASYTKVAPANPENVQFPIVVAWLVLGAIFFTLRMQFINLRGFKHAVVVTSGAYDHDDHDGEITHFQALSSALSATVGLGNIAGVAIAITVGGPGAIFWMIVAGFLGMSSKFTEVTLGQMYRVIRPDGTVSGGPMHYLYTGLDEMGAGALGRVLSILFAVMCIGGSLGGGNMFQANQSYAAIADIVPINSVVYGVILAGLVGMVIIGGIKRIGALASMIVPLMCGIYVLAALAVLIVNAAQVPAAFGAIVSEAFNPTAGLGGMFGVLATGFQRASFSNEAGVGSASIAHSAASTDEPVREGIVALLEPFIDTIVVCTMTGLVVVVTGVYEIEGLNGVLLTSRAFETVLPWFPVVLSVAVVLFAFSTMISWSYYGERCACYLFGEGAVLPYRVVFVIAVFLGANLKLGSVLDFSDLMVLGMAFPNILGAVMLSGKVKASLDEYLGKLAAGAFEH